MKVLKVIGAAVVIIVVLFVITGLLLPTTYSVERSIVINAAPEEVHEYVGDLDKWEVWEPWTESDPSIVVTKSETTSGVGASQSWTGDSGSGSLEFTMDSPDAGIEYDLTFDDKFECQSAMLYDRVGSSTEVTWIMSGDTGTPVIGGYFALVMDSMVGGMFEKGLTNLKRAVESGMITQE